MSFFCISGAQDDTGKDRSRTIKSTFLAKGEGTKAEKLNSDTALHSLQAVDTEAFELQDAGAARNWSK